MSLVVLPRVRSLLLALALAGVPSAFAQALKIPGMPSIGRSSAEAPASAPSEPIAEDWWARLEAAQAAHRDLVAQSESSTPLLAERQVASLRRVLLLTARVDALKTRSTSPGAAERDAVQIQPLAGPPPYDLLDVDALRDHLDALLHQRAALEQAAKSLDATIEAAIRNRHDAAAELRLRQEQLGRAGAGANAGEARAQAELAGMLVEVAELELLQGDEARQRARERLAALAAPIERLQAEIDRVRVRQRFKEADLRKVLDAIAVDRQRVTAAGAKLAERLGLRQSDSVSAGTVRAREVEALSQAMQALRELENAWRGQEAIWRARRDLLSPEVDAGMRRAAAARLSSGLADMDEHRNRLADDSRLLRADLRAQQSRLEEMAADDKARTGEQRVLEAMQVQADALERLRDGIDRTMVLMTRARADLGFGHRPASGREWLDRLASSAGAWFEAVWNYELFSATQTTEIEGRVVTVDHGVTVGKSVGVLVLFVVGYWLAGRLSHRIIALAARRLQLSDQLARVLRRWVNSILVLVVLLLVLKLARIPITAFAFLGGALAIGVGFGAQNVIKNLISGVIILFERKIRVGDIVSVGGMTGTVVTVDLRATTVRGFDGIDAIVPNSTLLENQINNWSGGSPEVRRSVTVGVAYGSDLRRVAKIIVECADAHPSVLKSPPAEVLLNDFGSDSLVFTLLYWTRLGGPRGGPSVDSDLRFAIAEALQAAGIAIPFPQRDVHLDMPGSLKVQLTGAPAPNLTPGPAPKA